MSTFLRFSLCVLGVSGWLGCAGSLVSEAEQQVDDPDVLFAQNFDGASGLADCIADPAGAGKFNHIGAEAGGAFRLVEDFAGMHLEHTRVGDAEADAGLTRWTDFPGETAPELLHVAFDLGVSGWTISTSQSNAFVLAVGSVLRFADYGGGEIAINTFQMISIKGEGTGRITFNAEGAKSHLLVADGRLHHVDLFLNNSPAAVSYQGPDGWTEQLRSGGFALWVNDVPVVVDAAAADGANGALTDLRMRWPFGDNGTWKLDNIVVRNALPQAN